MSSSAKIHGLTTQSENALNLTSLKLLRISSKTPHEDLLAFLSLVQSCRVGILPLMWYPALQVGRGGFAVLNESPVNKEFSFVFKRSVDIEFRADGNPKSLRSAMTELAILTHHNVRRHDHVVDLYGICWEVNPEENRILPVLVLERARLGDLFHLRNTQEGNNMSIETKLSLCRQIAEGLAMLHASVIIHGDIKPQNILIFESPEHNLVAKIADFGNSAAGVSEDDLCQLPRSDPWTAPEYHHRKFSISAAKRMDIYSFAMLCLWLLLDGNQGVVDAETSIKFLRGMKETSSLGDESRKVVKALKLENHMAQKLVVLFRTGLSPNPEARGLSMQDLAESLNFDPNEPTTFYRGTCISQEEYHVDFSISHNLYPLTYTNYLVRKLIFQCLHQKATTSTCSSCKSRATYELAFCYYVGFGVPKDNNLSIQYAQESGHDLEDMQDETDEVTDYIYVFDEADAVNSLRHRNFPMVMDHVNEYRRLEYDTNVVIETLAREIQNFEEAFQGQFLLTATMRGTLGTIYLGAGRVDNAEKVFRDLVRCFEESEDHGVMHRDTLWCQRLLAEVLRQNNKLQEAKELIHRVLKRSEKPDGEINPHIIECKANLGCIHFEADLLEEATTLFLEVQRDATQLLGLEHPQTLFAMTNLASAYRAQSMLSEAEELDLAVLDIKKRTLDDKNRSHYSTVTSAANLAFTYFLQKRWDEAMKIENWVLKERINSLGNDHPATLRARKQLEETKCHRDMALNQGLGSQEESLALKLQPKEPSSKKRKEFAA